MVRRNDGKSPIISRLTDTDLHMCCLLSAEAGWNQTADDWRLLIRAGAAQCIRDVTGSPIATTVALPYPPALLWIGMVLVAPAFRGRGFARALMADALRYAETAGLTPALDATPVGRPLYVNLGFESLCEISRWRREAGLPPGAGEPIGPSGESRPCASVRAALRRDAAAVGYERAALFEDLQRRDGTLMWCGPGDALAVVRRGRAAWQLGPVVAGAEALEVAVRRAVEHSRGEALVVDCFAENAAAIAVFEQAGFSRVRGFTRMALGRTATPVRSPRITAIAGPEYG